MIELTSILPTVAPRKAAAVAPVLAAVGDFALALGAAVGADGRQAPAAAGKTLPLVAQEALPQVDAVPDVSVPDAAEPPLATILPAGLAAASAGSASAPRVAAMQGDTALAQPPGTLPVLANPRSVMQEMPLVPASMPLPKPSGNDAAHRNADAPTLTAPEERQATDAAPAAARAQSTQTIPVPLATQPAPVLSETADEAGVPAAPATTQAAPTSRTTAEFPATTLPTLVPAEDAPEPGKVEHQPRHTPAVPRLADQAKAVRADHRGVIAAPVAEKAGDPPAMSDTLDAGPMAGDAKLPPAPAEQLPQDAPAASLIATTVAPPSSVPFLSPASTLVQEFDPRQPAPGTAIPSSAGAFGAVMAPAERAASGSPTPLAEIANAPAAGDVRATDPSTTAALDSVTRAAPAPTAGTGRETVSSLPGPVASGAGAAAVPASPAVNAPTASAAGPQLGAQRAPTQGRAARPQSPFVAQAPTQAAAAGPAPAPSLPSSAQTPMPAAPTAVSALRLAPTPVPEPSAQTPVPTPAPFQDTPASTVMPAPSPSPTVSAPPPAPAGIAPRQVAVGETAAAPRAATPSAPSLPAAADGKATLNSALPGSAPPAAAAPRPAGQVFAAALHAARTARPEDRAADPLVPTGPAPLATTLAPATAVPAGAAVDLRQESGLHTMVDRIEQLRDLANANDTRIRLVPDALGGVDIALRREGEAVHVHLRTDSAQAAQLLAEAQPRLVEIAEARGVRLAGTTVDTGAPAAAPQQGGQQAQQHGSSQGSSQGATQNHSPGQPGGQPMPQRPARPVPPAPPRARTAEDTHPSSDARVA